MVDETKPPLPDGQEKPGESAKPVEPAKPAAAPAAAAPPKPPAPAAPKPGPQPLDNDLVKRFKAKFGEAVREAWVDRTQNIIVVAREAWRDAARYARDDEKFNLLSDLTAVHWPKRERQFEIVANLYSFSKNERVRLKTQAADGESVASLCPVWPAANWLEREIYDMFGVKFDGHPDLKRILLPDEWQGFPLRKDYDILTQDADWIKENLGIDSGQ